MLKAPFPWFGGKSIAADLLWSRFGVDCGNYVEPFFGSGAVWFNRPAGYRGWSTVNDLDGNVANAWRAMRAKPEEVAEHACHPVNELDLTARHLWLVENLPKLAWRLAADPEYCEPRTAGWWIWGACCWIGSGWCAGDGPWRAVEDDEGVKTLAKVGGGVAKQMPRLSAGGQGVSARMPYGGKAPRGVCRQIPNNNKGQTGVCRKLPQVGDGGRGVNIPGQSDRLARLNAWFADLSASLSETRVCCGDWERVCSIGTMTANGTCAVLLDPPYSQTEAVYAHDSSTVSGDVRNWCLANGENPLLRVALCGHVGEHEELEENGWTVETWAKRGGYRGKDDRERIWFSPHCLKPEQGDLFQ
jgi:hypothetical protein